MADQDQFSATRATVARTTKASGRNPPRVRDAEGGGFFRGLTLSQGPRVATLIPPCRGPGLTGRPHVLVSSLNSPRAVPAARGILLGVMLAIAAPALAHQAPAGWEYDRDCCSDFDCAPAPIGGVREVAGGYQVSIPPGTHPRVPAGSAGVAGFVPHGDARIRVSGDAQRHACILGGRVLCLYIPPGGA